MYLTALAPSDIEFGERVLDGLRRARVPYSGAMWIRQSNASDWRLMLVTTLVDKVGPRATYQSVQKALRNLPEPEQVQLLKLWVVSPRVNLYKTLKAIFGKAKDVTGMRISNTPVDGVWIEDSYVYQIR